MQGNKIKQQQHLKDVENTSKTITRVEKKPSRTEVTNSAKKNVSPRL